MPISGAFEKAKHYIESHSKDSGQTKFKQGPCITISRETGAGADVVSSHLCTFLDSRRKEDYPGWNVFDKNLIQRVIENHNLPRYLGKMMEEKKIYGISQAILEMITGESAQLSLVHKTSQTILQLAQLGNVILIGRGAYIITASLSNSFRVRLIASHDDRLKHVMELYSLNRHDAFEFIKRDDQNRAKYLQIFFNKKIDDPLSYHLTINTSITGYENTAEIIGNAVLKLFPGAFKSEHYS